MLLLLLSLRHAQAQPRLDVQFQKFASRTAEKFALAWQAGNQSQCHTLLHNFEDQYKQLDKANAKLFSRQLAWLYYKNAVLAARGFHKRGCLHYLEKAVNAGFAQYKTFQQEAAFNFLDADPNFMALYHTARQNGDYRRLLRQAGKYSETGTGSYFGFTYQAAAHPALAALRSTLQLDTAAGTGTDTERLQRILAMVHNLMPHKGLKACPSLMNAQSLLATCRARGQGLNCRGLATILNECLLSLGYASRLVTCLPKDSLDTDPDLHVIATAWNPSLQKWLYLDPTNNAMVYDQDGMPLSIAEVRQYLINGTAMQLNADASYNGQAIDPQDYLQRYMAKNLYKLECGVISAADAATLRNGKVIEYIQLLPASEPLLLLQEIPARPSGATLRYVQTSDAGMFWQQPAPGVVTMEENDGQRQGMHQAREASGRKK